MSDDLVSRDVVQDVFKLQPPYTYVAVLTLSTDYVPSGCKICAVQTSENATLKINTPNNSAVSISMVGGEGLPLRITKIYSTSNGSSLSGGWCQVYGFADSSVI